jgi:hypothetical protein
MLIDEVVITSPGIGRFVDLRTADPLQFVGRIFTGCAAVGAFPSQLLSRNDKRTATVSIPFCPNCGVANTIHGT